ncbi:MAG TPA: Ig-like domain-containing protein, partial [Candidatus Obscuribacterales bacterium]
AQPQITFLDYELSPNNSDANLFAPDGGSGSLPLIEVSVHLQGTAAENPSPTGTVVFTAILPGGSRLTLGSAAAVDSAGKATVEVDSGIVGQPGVEIEAAYSGDQFFAATTKKDNGKTANDVQADPPVTDNPVIAPNAQNLTVVVVAGSGAERRQWRDSARRHYGANAFIITDVHSIADLGTRLANLPAGSISRLVIGARGSVDGPQLGNPGAAETRFNAANLNLAANANARNAIVNALGNNALIDLQACSCAQGQAGQANIQALANLLRARVRGADNPIGAWDDNSAN